MTILVSYAGRPVATVGARRIHLMPNIEALPDGDPVLRFVAAMCAYALEISQGSVPGPYSDKAAHAYAIEALVSEDDLQRVKHLELTHAAALLAVPVGALEARWRPPG